MSRASSISVDRRTAIKELTLQVKVTGKARFRVCVWIAVRLITLAGAILGPRAVVAVELDSAP